jgi:superfamily I DNA/RNA helicase
MYNMTSSNLDEHQLCATLSDHTKALIIQAGPGAGKTRTLISRVEHLLNVVVRN